MRKARRLPVERGGLVPAVALTAFASAKDNREAMVAGYQVHITKPVDAERLVRVVAELACWAESAG
jgi:CheY-like chemotaxis protein